MPADSDPNFPWGVLQLSPTTDLGAIRRAYAQGLRTIDRETDQAGFLALRRAYEAALAHAAGTPAPMPQAPAPPPEETSPIFEPLLREFAALAEHGKVGEAMVAVERFVRRQMLPVDQAGMFEARLFSIVSDDPFMPLLLLAALARYFRWNEVGSALEQHRPDLYERYLHRMGTAPGLARDCQGAGAAGGSRGADGGQALSAPAASPAPVRRGPFRFRSRHPR